ncbi:MAG: energy transducer TonB, partial [Bacteroidia bacterium]
VKQIQFTPPEVTEKEVEKPPPPQDEVKDTHVGEKTTEGTDDGPIGPVTPPVVTDPNENTVFSYAEVSPEFPGGEAALMKYLGENIKYPNMEKDNGVQGMVVLTFVVDQSGKISDIKTLKGVKGGPNLEKEAMRVVKTMPAWKPGKMNGKSVKVQFNLPVSFVLR